MKLEHAFTYRTAVHGPQVVRDGPFGLRHHYVMIDGVVGGPRIDVRVTGAASDWMLVEDDGAMRMDVRLQLATADGAFLLARYNGVAETSDRLIAALAAGEATNFDDQRIRTSWRLESGDPRHCWINRAVFVGEGRACPTVDGRPGFEHRVFAVA